MPIVEDLSELPTGGGDEGNPPVAHPVIVNRLAEAWHEKFLEGDDHTPRARWWASMSGNCARAAGYQIMQADAKRALSTFLADEIDNVNDLTDAEYARLDELSLAVVAAEQSNPPTIADAYRWGLGQMVHDALQAVLPDAFPKAEIEVRVEVEDFGSARADAVITEQVDGNPFVTALELKTTGGFAYKLMATSFKGKAEGPRSSAVAQGAVFAQEHKADRLVVGYLSMENLSPDVAARNGMDEIGRFAAEWHYTPEEFGPIAEAEKKRARKIIALVDEGTLPPRHLPDMPPRARITDPMTGTWTVVDDDGRITMAGKHWQCHGYCSWQGKCAADGPS